jgi:hypothetical protein
MHVDNIRQKNVESIFIAVPVVLADVMVRFLSFTQMRILFIYEPIVYKMWEPQHLKTLWASTACCRDTFTYLLLLVRSRVWSSGICDGQSGAGAGFIRVLRFPLPIFIPPIAPHSSSSIIRDW